jgi:RNA polymerase sigma-70 factor, ECF subfamily
MPEGRDERRASELFERHYRSVYRYFRRGGYSDQDARDLTQETFIRVFQHMEQLREDAAAVAWLFKIASHVRDNDRRFRRAARRAGIDVPVDAAPAGARDVLEAEILERHQPSTDALTALLHDEQIAITRQCLGELPPRMRHCLLRYADDHRRYKEIAEELGITIDGVKSHIHQARARLKACRERLLPGGPR